MYKKQLNKFLAFTVAELLITMFILGIIAAIMLPAIRKVSPDNNMILFKKSFKEASSIMVNLINDRKLYPEIDGFTYGNEEINFGVVTAGKVVSVNGVNYRGANKFCMAFASKVNIIGDTANGCIVELPNDKALETPSFSTTDNCDWYIQGWEPKVSYSYVKNSSNVNTNEIKKDILNPSTTILVDINGNKGPNCRASSYKDANDKTPLDVDFDVNTAEIKDNDCKKPDRFTLIVRYDGKIMFDGEVEQGYLMKAALTK